MSYHHGDDKNASEAKRGLARGKGNLREGRRTSWKATKRTDPATEKGGDSAIPWFATPDVEKEVREGWVEKGRQD